MMKHQVLHNQFGKSLGLAMAAAAALGGAADDAARELKKAFPYSFNLPNNRRRKVKDARKQNVRRLIAAKYA